MLRSAIAKTGTDLRAGIAYNLVRLAAWLYPPLMREMVDITCREIVKQGEQP